MGFDDFDLRLGDVMRGERATLGKSLLDVQRELKIKATHIAAIENCDVAAFDTPSFIAGYVRSYAKYLGMDPEATYARFCDEANFSVQHGMAPAAARARPAAPRPETGTRDPLANASRVFAPAAQPWYSRIEPGALGSVLVLAVLVGGLGYGGWSVLREIQRVQLGPVNAAPQVLADLDPVAGAARGAPQEAPALASGFGADSDWAAPELAAAASVDRPYRPQALDLPVLVARDGPIAAIDPDVEPVAMADARRPAPAAPGAAPGATAGSAAPGGSAVDRALAEALGLAPPAAEAPAPAPQTVRVLADAAPRVEIVAVRPSWVRVRAPDGTVLFEKILEPGERYEVPQSEAPAILRAGNSGSVYFVVNGRTYGPVAPGANVADNVALSADALTERFAVADLSADPDLAVHVAEARID